MAGEGKPRAAEKPPRLQALTEVTGLFLRLGVTAFGGPAAHVALMETEIVQRRQWLSREEFLDLLGATNLIPGPNSTEMAMHVGHRRAGWAGLLAGGIAFILPAALIVTGLAWAYVKFGTLPQATALLYGIKPVIIGVIAQALWRLGRTAAKTVTLGMVGLLAATANLLGVNELMVLFATGTLLMIGAAFAGRRGKAVSCLTPFLATLPQPALAAAVGLGQTAAAFGLWPLFLFFLKVGAVLFGSGYVLLAFLRADLVERWGWLSESQLLDAIAVGQVTPGPLFTAATFIGYLLDGGRGALVATVAIFLPAFVFVALSGPLLPKLRQSRLAGAFLDGVNVASLALMAVVTWQLGRAAIVDWVSLLLAALSGFLLFRYRLNSAWLVAGGALVGLLATAAGWRGG